MKRTLIAACAISALGLTSCMQEGAEGDDLDESAFQDPVAGEVEDGLLDGTTMTFVSWGGEFQTGQDQAFSEPFAEITGAEVLSDGPTDSARIQAQVESDNVTWDVVNASPTMNAAECGTLFEELDTDLLDLSNVPDTAPIGDCFVPSLVYVYGFFYDEDTYADNPPTSWEDFFDTENFPGIRAVDGRPTPTAGTFEAALLADGASEEDLEPLDTDRALEVWSGIEDDLVFWQTGAEQTQMAQSGEADMVFGWSGSVFEANENGANFTPVWDQSFMASDTFSITLDTPNRLAAYAYINFALGEAQQAQMAELTSYSPVHVDAQPEISEEAEEFNVTRPEVMDETIPQNAEYWGQNLSELTEVWEGWLTG